MKIPKLKQGQLIIVEFLDIEEDPAWQSIEQARNRPDIEGRACGFYLKHDEKILYLYTQEVGTGKDIKINRHSYPIGCIEKIIKAS